MKKNQRNGLISFWKFVFAVVIVLFHTRTYYENCNIPVFKYGYVACEFFFVVAGFYLAKKTLKEKYDSKTIGKETVQLLFKKIASFLPYLVVVYVIDLLVKTIILKLNIETIANSIWDLLLLREFGFKTPIMLVQLWFLPSLLTAIFILYPLVKKHKENFIYLCSPLIALFVLGYLSTIKVGLDFSYSEWAVFTRAGILRGFAEVNIGMIIYMIHTKLKNIKYTKFFSVLMTILSHALLIGVLLVTTFIERSPKYDFILLLAICLAVLIMVSEKTVDYKLFANKFNFFIEKISLPMYISHVLFFDIFKHVPHLKDLTPLNKSLFVLLSTIAFSILICLLKNYFEKHNYINKFKKYIIKK